MSDSKEVNWISKLVLFIFTCLFISWTYLQIFNLGDFSLQNQLFSAVYGLVALCGGIFGLRIAQKWGGFKSIIGRSISFLSLGLLAQVFGQITYSSYTFFLKIEIVRVIDRLTKSCEALC